MPNTTSTPQLRIVSTNTSLTVRTGTGGAGSATYTPSGRTSVAKHGGASSNGGGGVPVSGS